MRKIFTGASDEFGCMNGKAYEIVDEWRNYYSVIDESGEDYMYLKKYFKDVEEIMDPVKLAEFFATGAHAGQVDKAGRDYIEHPRFVASQVDGENEKIVAWLHDTVEDTGVTIELIEKLFGEEIAAAVEHMTHRKGEDYMAYIRRVSADPISRAVKLADLKHNMDLSRLPEITDADRERVEKYQRAMEILSANSEC